MRNMELTDRQKEVLRAVVLQHVRTAEPVASRALARRFQMAVSPATVRNVMVDLEEAGLLEQPHTSAGRVPTDVGYRVFVDRLMVKEAPTREEIVLLRTELGHERRTVESFLKRTSRALGKAADQLGIAISPGIRAGALARIEASPLAGGRLLLGFAFVSGAVRTIHTRMDKDEAGASLSEAMSWVNRRIDGLGLKDLSRFLEREIGSHMLPADWRGVFGLLREAVEMLLGMEEGEQVHFGGAANIMAQPEFSDPEHLRPIVAMMEQSDLLVRSLAGAEEEGVRIIIGRENKWRPMRHCSLVVSTYQSGSVRGRIGVVGPIRMPYPRLVPLVERAAEIVSRSLESM
ncbi:MAG: heat-inducible transcription repressor HrcA [Candidatus Eisenbacteria sp.]|nr:heat-inducible transcription repressor HrcA [Candidatus Eisenbacteria bacterium]